MKQGLAFFLLPLLLLQAPKSRAETPPSGLEQVLSAHPRLLVFSPHPDDAALGAGGLMQRVLHVGGTVEVVYLTSGDGYAEGIRAKDHILHPSAQDCRAYGALRQDEALQALASLGVDKCAVLFLGFPDRG